MQRLHLDKNRFGDSICRALSENLTSNIYDLSSLAYNGVGKEGFSLLIGGVLARNNTLRYLKTNHQGGEIKTEEKVCRWGKLLTGVEQRNKENCVLFLQLEEPSSKKLWAFVDPMLVGQQLKLCSFLSHDRPSEEGIQVVSRAILLHTSTHHARRVSSHRPCLY